MRCPICRRPVDESELGKKGSFYPFCSDRCRLIDLGRWLGGKYQIPVREEDAPAGGDDEQRRPKGNSESDAVP